MRIARLFRWLSMAPLVSPRLELPLVPAWTSYSRWYERIGAAVLSLYVLAAFVGLGLGGGAAVVWFWDRVQV